MPSNRILVVEDEPNIVESLRFILERANYDVESEPNGLAALDRMRARAFAAVVLDIMLPGMNGLDVLRAMKKDETLATLPVIVLTAKGQTRDRKAAEEIGVDAFITKPYSNSEVVEQVEKFARR